MAVTGGRVLHVHQGWRAVDGRRRTPVEHEEAVRQTIVIHVRVREVLLILVNNLAHLRAELLSVGVAAADGATEQVAALSRGSLLPVTIHRHLSVGTGASAPVHLANQMHLVRSVHKLTTVAHAAVDSADALRTVVAAGRRADVASFPDIGSAKVLDLALRSGRGNLIVVLLLQLAIQATYVVVVWHILLHRA